MTCLSVWWDFLSTLGIPLTKAHDQICLFRRASDVVRIGQARARRMPLGSSLRERGTMPVFVIERRFAEQIDPNAEDVREINEINADEDVRWLMSFLSADKRKTYCLYEAESAEAILRAAARAGLPADVVTEVTARVLPDGSQVAVV
jgi:hypothetical protein